MLTSSLIASRQPDRSAPYPSLPIFTSNKISRRPSSFHSASYKMLFQQLLCFENDPSFMGGVYRGVCPSPIPHPFLFRFSFALFCTHAKPNSFIFKLFRNSLSKNTGGGVSRVFTWWQESSRGLPV